MGEGNTPLVESVSLGPRLGLRLWFKLEMCNPTGSYKDRFVAAQLSELLRNDVGACVATSSGNTGASLAAYCARYRLACIVLVNEFAPLGKLAQMQAHGARVFCVKQFLISSTVTGSVYQKLLQISERAGIPIVVSAYRYCPAGMCGVERIAAEVGTACPDADHVFVPVGGGGLLTAVCRGLEQFGSSQPKVHAVQPEGCSTVVSAFNAGRHEITPVTSTTAISGLAVPFDVDASLALGELARHGGRGVAVSDQEIFGAQRAMLREEGIWCEPAAAASLAGCLHAREQGWIAAGESVICIVTGHGFKDSDSLACASRDNPVALIQEDQIGAELFQVCA